MTQLVQTLVFGVLIGGIYALAASGLTLIFGVMNIVNVAHGAMLILSAYLTFAIWSATGIDPLLLIFATTPAMFAAGWLLYRTTMVRIRKAPASMSVLLTFAIALIIEGAIGLHWQGIFRTVRPGYVDASFVAGGIYLPQAQVYGFGVAVLTLGALYAILNRTWAGRAIRAAAENPDSARLVGVDTVGVAAVTFALGAATAGTAGSIVSMLYPFFPASHYQWISRLLGIIVLGGMGSIPGALLGAITLGIAETLTATYVSVSWATMVPAAVIFVTLLVRPRGLLGSRTRADVALT